MVFVMFFHSVQINVTTQSNPSALGAEALGLARLGCREALEYRYPAAVGLGVFMKFRVFGGSVHMELLKEWISE